MKPPGMLAVTWLLAGCASTVASRGDGGVDTEEDASLDAAPDAELDAAPTRDEARPAPGDVPACPPGLTRCGDECADLATYLHHCGACFHDCSGLPGVRPEGVGRCVAGVCDVRDACRPGLGHCTDDPEDGCETNLTLSNNCGVCGYRCPATAPLCVSYRTCACAAGTGAPDQSQPGADGVIELGPGGSVRQGFTAGFTGVLTGVELGVSLCTTSRVTSNIRVAVFDEEGAPLMEPLTAYVNPTDGCAAAPLGAGPPGRTYVNLIPRCVRVVAGQRYALSVTFPELGSPCMSETGRCTGGRWGAQCSTHADCASTLGLSRSSAAPYAGGEGAGPGTTGAFDLTFRTFVR